MSHFQPHFLYKAETNYWPRPITIKQQMLDCPINQMLCDKTLRRLVAVKTQQFNPFTLLPSPGAWCNLQCTLHNCESLPLHLNCTVALITTLIRVNKVLNQAETCYKEGRQQLSSVNRNMLKSLIIVMIPVSNSGHGTQTPKWTWQHQMENDNFITTHQHCISSQFQSM